MPRSLTRLTLAVGLPSLAALGAVAFWPTPVDAGRLGDLDRLIAWFARHGLGGVDYDLLESTANIVLFVPLGFLAALHLRVRWTWTAVALGALLSAGIETAQLLFLSARFGSTHDVVTNTIGSGAGALLGAAARTALRARESRRAAEQDAALAYIPLRGTSGFLGDHRE